MKMNFFVKFMLFYTLIQHSEAKSCHLKPTGVESLHVQVFYGFLDSTCESTRHLIKAVCDNYKLFGDKMTVEFMLVTFLYVPLGGYPIYPPQWKEEITEMCTQIIAPNNIDYICCAASREECLAQQNISPNDVASCVDLEYESTAGQRLLDNYQAMSDAGAWDGTLPALHFNNQKYDKCTDHAGYADFVNTCCKLYNPDSAPKPPC